jgi:adenylate kinase
MAPLVIILGPTGAGKSYQSKEIAHRHGWTRISSGDLLRATGNEDILKSLAKGELTETTLVQGLLEEALTTLPIGRGLVLDGFPRMMSEVEWLEANMSRFNLELKAAIEITVAREVSNERLQHRNRTDDEKKAIDHKWREYEKETKPVLDHYRKQGKLVEVDGTPDEPTVAREIEKKLGVSN